MASGRAGACQFRRELSTVDNPGSSRVINELVVGVRSFLTP